MSDSLPNPLPGLSLPLHCQNPQTRFSDRAEDYANYRPSYPAEAITAMLEDLGEPASLTAADIGAGTGISSRLVANRGVKVWAIEPNAAMREAAQPHPNVEFRVGTAEQTGLQDPVDLVFCTQAFHWFEPIASLQEFHRILKPAGRVALIWNDRDRDDEFTNQYTDILRQAVDPTYMERLDRKASDATSLQQSEWFENYRVQSFPNRHPLDRIGLVGMALSASYVPKSGEAHERLVSELQQLYDRWPEDAVRLAYRTHLFLAEAKLV